MPKTRSARNSVEEQNQSSLSNGNESQLNSDSLNKSLPTSDKCLTCKEEFDVRLPNYGLDMAVNCPCILSLCQSCADKSKLNEEYCPSDNHLDENDFFEKEIQSKMETVNMEDLAGMDKIPFIFNNKYMIYHTQPQTEEEFLKMIESKSMISSVQLQSKGDGLRTLECRVPNVVNNSTVNNIIVNNKYYTTVNIFCSKDYLNSKQQSKKKLKKFQRKPSSKKSSLTFWSLVIAGFGILGIGILIGAHVQGIWTMYGHLIMGRSSTGPITDESVMIKHVFDQVQTLESKYTKQSQDLWGTLKRGMRNLVKKSKEPMTILLLHSENTTVDTCFLRDIKKIANEVVEYQMREESNGAENTDMNAVATKRKPKGVIIDMEANSDIFDNPGVFMEKYKAQLEQEKLMIVVNFHKSPKIVMEAFHFLTDAYDPYINNILIILTVEVKDKNYNDNNNVETIAEHELADLLESLPDHKSEPLITRLTENVYMIREERSMFSMSCSLF